MIDDAIRAIQAGDIVLVTDDEDRENEGDLIMAADAATPEKIGFFLRHTAGVICASLSAQRCDQLQLPLMVADNTEAQGTAFTVSVDLTRGTTTGISARDRAATLRGLAEASFVAADFARPGHIFPLRSRDGGVLKRAGHTEAARAWSSRWPRRRSRHATDGSCAGRGARRSTAPSTSR